ncbi:YfhO family protein [Streptomyces sp. NPDC048659]|uniref:YfhO family protein n=1 Tax=Streptomyces sp. NPDC048659 TaxID=3155489 RepID=UPI003445E12C
MKIRIPRAAGLAALLTVAAVCAGDAVASTFPFGRHRRAVNDLANQFLPFHAHLWDLLHGRADGGPLLNWQSGWGSSLLPDLATYVTSPFAPLVALFPRADLAYALYGITVLKTACAAAAMAWTLRRLRPGPWWAAGLLGAAYALCGWALLEAVYNPMWMDGLIAFPLLCLVGVWVREGRRPLLGVLVVAVCWTANFYTAYMATLGAALVLLVAAPPWRVLLRGAATVLLGAGLTAPLLLPVFLGTRYAYPGVVRDFAAADGADLAARLLPATYSFSTPALFVFTAVPVLAAVPLFRAGRGDRRWPLLAAGVLLSFQWAPTHLVWHAFATPNGSPYRQTFVLTGILVIAAWHAVADGFPGRRALLGGTALVGALALPALGSAQATGWGWALFAAGLAAPFVPRRGRYAAPVLAVSLAAVLVAQAAATTAWGDKERLARLDDYPAWSAADTRRAAALAEADGWPAYRTDSGRPQVTGNEPMALGGQGAAYYSSLTSNTLTETLRALGGGWTSRGRNLQSLDNPVTDALFAVGARWRDGAVVRTGPAAPLVTVRPPGPPPRYGASPFRNQELLLGARVYEPPAPGGACRAGTETFVWAPDFTGTARLGARTVKLRGQLPKWRAALASLGTPERPAAPVLAGQGHRGEVACLDHARLDAAVAALRSAVPATTTVTPDGFRVTLAPGTRGTVVLAAPRIPGWHCEGRPADAYGGLVATPATGRTSVTCAFRPPGLRAGLAAGGAAALLLAGWVVWGAWGRRRTGRPMPSQGDPMETNSPYHALT